MRSNAETDLVQMCGRCVSRLNDGVEALNSHRAASEAERSLSGRDEREGVQRVLHCEKSRTDVRVLGWLSSDKVLEL
jgi:hypothetical protein